MKYFKKILAILAIVWIVHITHSAPLWVEKITVVDENTISVVLSENPNLEVGEIEAELTVLSDTSLRWAILAQGSTNTVELILEDVLMPLTNYSLLTISGADGSIDFTTPESIEWFSATNTLWAEAQNIISVEVIDDRTLLVEYISDVTATNFEYKLLAESTVSSIMKPDYFNPEIIITVDPSIESQRDYILMFIEMQDVDGEFIEFDTGIYDFTAPDLTDISSDSASGSLLEDTQDEELISDMLWEALWEDALEESNVVVEDENEAQSQTGETLPDLTAAWDEVSLEKDSQDDDMTLLEAAGSVEATPDTGAETWVILIATLVINTIYYLSRRKKAVLV